MALVVQVLPEENVVDRTPPPEERCDRCSAAAKVLLTLARGELVFCGHHANKYAERILATATLVGVEPGFDWRGHELMAEAQRLAVSSAAAVPAPESPPDGPPSPLVMGRHRRRPR